MRAANEKKKLAGLAPFDDVLSPAQHAAVVAEIKAGLRYVEIGERWLFSKLSVWWLRLDAKSARLIRTVQRFQNF
jgi:hypothetical protein